LAQFPDGHVPADSPPYGVILQCCTIRDFGKFGIDNVSADGRSILSWILGIAMDNYPELLYRSHFINVPWLFNTLWTFVKGLIDPNTQRKMTMNGDGGMDKLLADLPSSSIPRRLGGTYDGYNTPFVFNVTESGPFHYKGRPVFAVVADMDHMAAARAYIEKCRADKDQDKDQGKDKGRAGASKLGSLLGGSAAPAKPKPPRHQLAVSSPSQIVFTPAASSSASSMLEEQQQKQAAAAAAAAAATPQPGRPAATGLFGLFQAPALALPPVEPRQEEETAVDKTPSLDREQSCWAPITNLFVAGGVAVGQSPALAAGGGAAREQSPRIKRA